MPAKRRTPTEMARDRHAAQERKLADLHLRRGHAQAEVDRLDAEIDDVTVLCNWLASNPLLTGKARADDEGGED